MKGQPHSVSQSYAIALTMLVLRSVIDDDDYHDHEHDHEMMTKTTTA